MATVAGIRLGLFNALGAAFGTNEQVSQYMLSESAPPTFDIVPNGVSFDIAMQRGGDRFEFLVRLLIGAVTDVGAQLQLDGYLNGDGTKSVKAAIEKDRSLNGACSSLRVTDISPYKQYDRPGGPALGVEWTVEVYS